MHVVKKRIHVKIEKLVKTVGKTIRRLSITVRFVFVRQCLTNTCIYYITIHNDMFKTKIIYFISCCDFNEFGFSIWVVTLIRMPTDYNMLSYKL